MNATTPKLTDAEMKSLVIAARRVTEIAVARKAESFEMRVAVGGNRRTEIWEFTARRVEPELL